MRRGVSFEWGYWFILVCLHTKYLKSIGRWEDDTARAFQAHKTGEAAIEDDLDLLTGTPENLPAEFATQHDYAEQFDIDL